MAELREFVPKSREYKENCNVDSNIQTNTDIDAEKKYNQNDGMAELQALDPKSRKYQENCDSDSYIQSNTNIDVEKKYNQNDGVSLSDNIASPVMNSMSAKRVYRHTEKFIMFQEIKQSSGNSIHNIPNLANSPVGVQNIQKQPYQEYENIFKKLLLSKNKTTTTDLLPINSEEETIQTIKKRRLLTFNTNIKGTFVLKHNNNPWPLLDAPVVQQNINDLILEELKKNYELPLNFEKEELQVPSNVKKINEPHLTVSCSNADGEVMVKDTNNAWSLLDKPVVQKTNSDSDDSIFKILKENNKLPFRPCTIEKFIDSSKTESINTPDLTISCTSLDRVPIKVCFTKETSSLHQSIEEKNSYRMDYIERSCGNNFKTFSSSLSNEYNDQNSDDKTRKDQKQEEFQENIVDRLGVDSNLFYTDHYNSLDRGFTYCKRTKCSTNTNEILEVEVDRYEDIRKLSSEKLSVKKPYLHKNKTKKLFPQNLCK